MVFENYDSEVIDVTVNEVLIAAVEPIIPDCVPDVYDGENLEYCVFNCTEIPDDFGDDQPWAIRYLVQLHWYLPAGSGSPEAKKRQIRQALIAAGFTAPTITPDHEEAGLHFVFECEWLDGGV